MTVDNRFLEPTFLNAEFCARDLNEAIPKIKESGVVGVTLPSFWVKKAVRELGDSDVIVSTAVGYPLGFHQSIVKLTEAKEAISQGALGIHLVWSETAYLSGMSWPKIEVAQLSKLCHEEGCFLSVMVSPKWVSKNENLLEVARTAQDAGADYLTLGLDFSEEVEAAQVQLLRETLSSQVGIRVFSKYNEPKKLQELLKAGADKIHVSGNFA